MNEGSCARLEGKGLRGAKREPLMIEGRFAECKTRNHV